MNVFKCVYISTASVPNVRYFVDIFTKALGHDQFFLLSGKLGVMKLYAPTWRKVIESQRLFKLATFTWLTWATLPWIDLWDMIESQSYFMRFVHILNLYMWSIDTHTHAHLAAMLNKIRLFLSSFFSLFPAAYQDLNKETTQEKGQSC